jgi:preprotein translocase subunit SecD
LKKALIPLIILLIVAGVLIFTAFRGLHLGSKIIPSAKEGVAFDLDIVGGTELVFEAQIPEGTSEEDAKTGMQTLSAMLRRRLLKYGYSNATLKQVGDDSFLVDIPRADDIGDLAEKLASPAEVNFVDYQGVVYLTRADISAAREDYGSLGTNETMRYYISVDLTKEGYQKFIEATKKIAAYPAGSNYLEVTVDGESISKPFINSAYADTGINTYNPKLVLEDSTNKELADYIAGIITSGRTAFTLTAAEQYGVSPAFGSDTLKDIVRGGLIGVLAVMLLLFAFYRRAALFTDAVLLLFVPLYIVILSISGLKMSLPGLTGIFLSVFLLVFLDAALLEELTASLVAGTPPETAVKNSYQLIKPVSTDVGVILMILSIVLLWKGSGQVCGFGQTMLIGTVLAMLCATAIQKPLLKSAAKNGLL